MAAAPSTHPFSFSHSAFHSGAAGSTPTPRISDPEIAEHARRLFIDYGGKAIIRQNADGTINNPPVDSVQPSPRHAGMARYLTRLLRPIWKATLLTTKSSPATGTTYAPTVGVAKLQTIQKDLVALQTFCRTNKSFIEGLSGPDALSRVASKEEEIILQGEHRALHALTSLLADTIEGLSFVLLLFEEELTEVVALLPEPSKVAFPKLTYEQLFSSAQGTDVAKDLVKAIVNRNIAKGSNVETIAEGLRRRCGSFCSAEDVVIFKAQEMLKRAAEVDGGNTDSEQARALLNDSLDLFRQVAGCLPMDYLEGAVNQYIKFKFFAGAIHLCLGVAAALDPTNRALSWVRDGCPDGDPRSAAFYSRRECYALIYNVIATVDELSSNDPGVVDGMWTVVARRKAEAYQLISSCQDEVFLTSLYDWYLQNDMSDRLLEVKTPFVVTYLRRKASEDSLHADLLWKYHIQLQQFHEAAAVQLELARGALKLDLGKRIEYLGQASANASVYSSGSTRAARQRLVQEISALLDVANVQYDLLQRLSNDPRVNPDKRDEVIEAVNGEIMDLSTLFNLYADPGGYFDICLQIMYLANHRNVADIKLAWERLISHVHTVALEADEAEPEAAHKPMTPEVLQATLTRSGQARTSRGPGSGHPYEAVAETIRVLAGKLQLSTTVFPVPVLLPLLERYVIEHQLNVGPPNWVVDLFLDLDVPHETLYTALEALFYNDEVPFTGKNRRYIGRDLLFLVVAWYKATMLSGTGIVFGSEVMARRVADMLALVQTCGLDEKAVQLCGDLRENIRVAFE
ncbi:hypothetical protein KEM52_004977 [Ascosphaera acerosa]|nr:hypothetical protein KEM52_004977 [Ascosphaera acerosa]